MADLTANDVTVTLNPDDVDFMTFNKVVFPVITFGGEGKTYGAANGIPLPGLEHFGLNKEIKRAKVVQPANGYIYHIDRDNHKLRIFRSAGFTPVGEVAAPTFTGEALAAHNHDLKVIGGAAPVEAVGISGVGNDTLSKEAATDRTVVGADSATKGGVVGGSAGMPAGTCSAPDFTGVAVDAAPLVEVDATHAPAATSLELEIIGQ